MKVRYWALFSSVLLLALVSSSCRLGGSLNRLDEPGLLFYDDFDWGANGALVTDSPDWGQVVAQ